MSTQVVSVGQARTCRLRHRYQLKALVSCAGSACLLLQQLHLVQAGDARREVDAVGAAGRRLDLDDAPVRQAEDFRQSLYTEAPIVAHH